MGEQMAKGDRVGLVAASPQEFLVLALEQASDGVVQGHPALLHQPERGRGDERLGHARDPEPRPGLQRPVATQLLDAGGHLEVDPEPRREDVQQSPRHLRPRRQIGVDQRLEPFLVAHAAKGAKPVQGRTCSRAAPIRNAVTSS